MIHHELKQAVHSYILTQDRLILSDWIEEYVSYELAVKIRNLPEECPEPTFNDIWPEGITTVDRTTITIGDMVNAKFVYGDALVNFCPHPENIHSHNPGIRFFGAHSGISMYGCEICWKKFFRWERWPLSLYHRVAMSIYGYIFKPGTALVEDTLFGAWPIETNLDPPWIVTNGINEWTGRIGVRKSGSTEVQWFTISPRKSSNAMATS